MMSSKASGRAMISGPFNSWLMTPEQLHVGTPRELADQGVLNTFIEHEGITFDTDTLTIQIRK